MQLRLNPCWTPVSILLIQAKKKKLIREKEKYSFFLKNNIYLNKKDKFFFRFKMSL